jgi:hypothetical protein
MLLQTGAISNGAPQQSKVLPISATASSDFGASHHAIFECWFIASEEILSNNIYRLFAIVLGLGAVSGNVLTPMLDLQLRSSPSGVRA